MLPDPPDGLPWPPGTAWAWRPPLWQGEALARSGDLASGDAIGAGLKVFHTGDPGAVRAGQDAGAPLSLWMAAGAFASLVFDVETAALDVLTPRSIVRLAGRAALSGPGTAYGRVNVRHGPNTATQTREAVLGSGVLDVAFDLSRIGLGHAAMAQVWVDLMVAQPDATVLSLHDLALSCHPRAEL